jgi:hypothetical protein
MVAGLSEVVEQFVTVTPGILKGIGQDGKAVEGFHVVDAEGQGMGGGGKPQGVKFNGSECVSEEFPHEISLGRYFREYCLGIRQGAGRIGMHRVLARQKAGRR